MILTTVENRIKELKIQLIELEKAPVKNGRWIKRRNEVKKILELNEKVWIKLSTVH